MSTMDRLRSTDVNPQTALFSIVLLLALAAGTITVIVKMMNGGNASAPAETPASGRTAVRTASAAQVATPVETGTKTPVTEGDDYSIIAKRNLFRPPGAKQAPAQTEMTTPPAFGSATPEVVTESPFGADSLPPAVPPAPRLAYTGKVDLPFGTYALLENLETSEAVYVQAGEAAFGCTVMDIGPTSATLDHQGTLLTLAIGANKVEVATPKPTQPTPAAAAAGNTPPTAANASPNGSGRPTSGSSGGGSRGGFYRGSDSGDGSQGGSMGSRGSRGFRGRQTTEGQR